MFQFVSAVMNAARGGERERKREGGKENGVHEK